MRRAVAVALAVYVAGLALFTGFVAVPFVTNKRDIPAAVPSPVPLLETSLDVLRPGQRMCMSDIAMSAESDQVRLRAGTYGLPGPPLAVSVRGQDYHAEGAVGAGYADNAAVSANVPAPPSGRLVTVCVRNSGAHKVAFYAAADRAESHAAVFVAGKRVVPTPTLSFNERSAVSVANRAGVIAGRIAVFRGFLDHAWVVWLLAAAALLVVPVLAGLGMAAAMRDQRSTVSSGE
jgi:hypothetical protein